MATEMKVWQVSQKEGLVPIPDTPLEASHLESELESWIEKTPEILAMISMISWLSIANCQSRSVASICFALTGPGRLLSSN